ncbi:MAG: 30S ribosomal protein S15 [Bdellovibrionales bacterium]|nr:30S ribosomal protein S15 [Bdellovibrionales bacterium]
MTTNNQQLNINEYRRSDSDTGSTEVQIAQLTKRVRHLTQHFQKHKKDFHSRSGLIRIINERKSLLSYLKRVHFERYQSVVQRLGLRK